MSSEKEKTVQVSLNPSNGEASEGEDQLPKKTDQIPALQDAVGKSTHLLECFASAERRLNLRTFVYRR